MTRVGGANVMPSSVLVASTGVARVAFCPTLANASSAESSRWATSSAPRASLPVRDPASAEPAISATLPPASAASG
jgi:hypothetical protein